MRNYNHFVVRNIKVVEVDGPGEPGLGDGITGGQGQITDVDNRVIVANDNFQGTVSIQMEFREELSTGNFENLGNVTYDLTKSLCNKWEQGGNVGSGIADVPDSNSVRVTNYGNEGAYIGNINIGEGGNGGFEELFIEFNIEDQDALDTGRYYFTIYMRDSDGEMVGSNDFIVKTKPLNDDEKRIIADESSEDVGARENRQFRIYSNPAKESFYVAKTQNDELKVDRIFLTDLTGKQIKTKRKLVKSERCEFNVIKSYSRPLYS